MRIIGYLEPIQESLRGGQGKALACPGALVLPGHRFRLSPGHPSPTQFTKRFLIVLSLISFSVGCEVPPIESGGGSSASPASSAAADKPEATLFGKEDWYLPDGRVDMTGVEGEPPMTTGVPREITAKDPKKGKLTRRDGGALGTGLQALPWAENETIFNIVIKQALAQYDAIKGQYPQSHQQFMEEFLPEFCPQIKELPELEPGDAYLYDPEDHLLKIFRPGEPGAPQVDGVRAY